MLCRQAPRLVAAKFAPLRVSHRGAFGAELPGKKMAKKENQAAEKATEAAMEAALRDSAVGLSFLWARREMRGDVPGSIDFGALQWHRL